MKRTIVLALFSSIYSFANAGSNFSGKCASQASEAVMEAYGEAIDEGNSVAVVSSKVSKDPSVYKVLVAVMDGSGEPFTQALDVTLDAETCQNPTIEFSR